MTLSADRKAIRFFAVSLYFFIFFLMRATSPSKGQPKRTLSLSLYIYVCILFTCDFVRRLESHTVSLRSRRLFWFTFFYCEQLARPRANPSVLFLSLYIYVCILFTCDGVRRLESHPVLCGLSIFYFLFLLRATSPS